MDLVTLDNGDTIAVNTTFSHGTLRPQDTVTAFMSVLRIVSPQHWEAFLASPYPSPPAHAQEDEDAEWWYSEECDVFVEQLFDILNENAPDGYYFGAHPGDGSDFGYWEVDENEL